MIEEDTGSLNEIKDKQNKYKIKSLIEDTFNVQFEYFDNYADRFDSIGKEIDIVNQQLWDVQKLSKYLLY